MIHLCSAKGRDVYHNLNNDGGRLDDIVDLDYKRKELRIAIDGEMTRAHSLVAKNYGQNVLSLIIASNILIMLYHPVKE